MADIKISELTAVSSLNNGDLVEVSQVNELAPSGYTSLKASMADIGKKVNTDIEYTTDLADFTDKTIVGAIKETAKDKNVADEYDDTQTYNKGDVVIYKNTLYICTTNNTTGTWDASKWTATTIDNVIGSLSTLTTTDKSSLVGAVNEVNKPIVIDVDGGTITVSHIGNIYTIGLEGCPVSAIYSNLASFTTAKKFRFVAWDMQYNKACIISIGGGSVAVYSDTMVQIPNTDNRTVSGGATYIKS